MGSWGCLSLRRGTARTGHKVYIILQFFVGENIFGIFLGLFISNSSHQEEPWSSSDTTEMGCYTAQTLKVTLFSFSFLHIAVNSIYLFECRLYFCGIWPKILNWAQLSIIFKQTSVIVKQRNTTSVLRDNRKNDWKVSILKPKVRKDVRNIRKHLDVKTFATNWLYCKGGNCSNRTPWCCNVVSQVEIIMFLSVNYSCIF